MATLSTSARLDARTASSARARAALRKLLVGLMIWFGVYLILQGQDGFFAITLDRVDAMWVKVLVLNIPLQLALTVGAGLCGQARSVRVVRTGLVLAGTALLLVVAHVVLSFATA